MSGGKSGRGEGEMEIAEETKIAIWRALREIGVEMKDSIGLARNGNKVKIIIDGKGYGEWDIEKGTFG